MRRAMIAAFAALASMSTTAYAADIYSKGGSLKDAPEAYEAPKTWTGFYIGVGVGAGASVTDVSINEYKYDGDQNYGSSFNFDGIGGEGVFGTVQIGYDRQLSSRFVLGAFLDYDFSNINSELNISRGDSSYNADLDLEHMWSVGARLGWLATPDTMWYTLVAYTQAKYDLSNNGGFVDRVTNVDDFQGWSIGAGVETRLGDNWSLKGEYRFTQLDGETIAGYDGDGEGFNVDFEPSVHTARVVLSYRLNPFHEALDASK